MLTPVNIQSDDDYVAQDYYRNPVKRALNSKEERKKGVYRKTAGHKQEQYCRYAVAGTLCYGRYGPQ